MTPIILQLTSTKDKMQQEQHVPYVICKLKIVN